VNEVRIFILQRGCSVEKMGGSRRQKVAACTTRAVASILGFQNWCPTPNQCSQTP